MKMSDRDTRMIVGVVLVVFGVLMLVVSVGAVSFALKKDNDADGTPDILEGDDNGGTVVVIGDGGDGDTSEEPGGGTGGGVGSGSEEKYTVSFAVDANRDGDYDDPGDRSPENTDGVIALVRFDTDNLYDEGHPQYERLVLLNPEQQFSTYLTFVYRGEGKKAVTFDVRLLLAQGSLPKGYLMHKVTDKVIELDTAQVTIKPGQEKQVTLQGRTPEFIPGKSWWLPIIVVEADGKEVLRRGMWRLDRPIRYRWITLKHKDAVCPEDMDTELIDRCIRVIDNSDSVDISFSAPGLAKIDRVVIYQITYPGKYRLVYDGAPEREGGVVAFFRGHKKITIKKSAMATMYPNEGYLKISVWAYNMQLDLNKDPNDMSARINVPFKIVGGSPWKGTREYYSSVGFLQFSSLGGGGDHPEKQWFE